MKIPYTVIIGLEVHVELATSSKMFCGCSAEHFGVTPNTHTCPVCLGLPGALPVPNKKAVEWTIMLGLALGCSINEDSKFDRKNYFYPDLSKGYQISQYDEPLAVNGEIKIQDKPIRIRRVHLEEDTGKLQHETVNGEEVSLVDFNRSGVPLVEIVTEPDFRTIEEVDLYLKKLQRIIRYLGISQADMEKGSMRLEPSISLSLDDSKLPSYRVELKNINSFRFARRALEYEIKRQSELLDRGETIPQQTRGWNEAKGVTVAQREKEEANDYRYFPEPDIPPMNFTQSQIADIKAQIPEMPDQKLTRFIKIYGLSEYDASLLIDDFDLAHYFELAVKDGAKLDNAAKHIANWLINKKINYRVTVPGELISKIAVGLQTTQVDDSQLEEIIGEVLANNLQAVEDYKKGKTAVIGLFIGEVLKRGNFDKAKVIGFLNKKLKTI